MEILPVGCEKANREIFYPQFVMQRVWYNIRAQAWLHVTCSIMEGNTGQKCYLMTDGRNFSLFFRPRKGS